MTLTIKAKRVHPRAKLPAYMTPGANAFDVCAVLDEPLTLKPGEHAFIKTGVIYEAPPGYMLMLNVRSGMGAKSGMGLRNTIGYIDSDFRGELMVVLQNRGTADYTVTDGDRIAQMALIHAPQAQIVEVDEVGETARGKGGFGSTGTSTTRSAQEVMLEAATGAPDVADIIPDSEGLVVDEPLTLEGSPA